MTPDIGKVVLNTTNCEITVLATDDGVKLYIQQGGHIVILTVQEWNEARRAADRAINFIGEVMA